MTLSKSFQTDKFPIMFPSLKTEVLASDIAELKKLRLEQKIREDIRDVDRLGEMIREKVWVEKEASTRERIDDEVKRFVEASGEMIREKVRVKKKASARERIDDKVKRFVEVSGEMIREKVRVE